MLKKIGKKLVGVAAITLGAVGSAAAALPAAVGTALTALETDANALFDLVWPILIGLTGVVILMKLFKRGANKI